PAWIARSIPASAAWNARAWNCSLPAICSSSDAVVMPEIASSVSMSSSSRPTTRAAPRWRAEDSCRLRAFISGALVAQADGPGYDDSADVVVRRRGIDVCIGVSTIVGEPDVRLLGTYAKPDTGGDDLAAIGRRIVLRIDVGIGVGVTVDVDAEAGLHVLDARNHFFVEDRAR